jgi:hypothetical protein
MARAELRRASRDELHGRYRRDSCVLRCMCRYRGLVAGEKRLPCPLDRRAAVRGWSDGFMLTSENKSDELVSISNVCWGQGCPSRCNAQVVKGVKRECGMPGLVLSWRAAQLDKGDGARNQRGFVDLYEGAAQLAPTGRLVGDRVGVRDSAEGCGKSARRRCERLEETTTNPSLAR